MRVIQEGMQSLPEAEVASVGDQYLEGKRADTTKAMEKGASARGGQRQPG